ncbi:unnamed protein product [Arabidopsis halleri]
MATADEEAISQSENQRGVSDWNFDVRDLKTQASLLTDEDDLEEIECRQEISVARSMVEEAERSSSLADTAAIGSSEKKVIRQLLLALGLGIACALSGVTFRYAVRRDLDDSHLKSGAGPMGFDQEPQHRLAYRRGATEMKQHPFFEGVKWALVRCATPPEIPKPVDMESAPATPHLPVSSV